MLKIFTQKELSNYPVKEREVILSPWLLSHSLNMIHAWRGIGKSYLALEICKLVAAGSEESFGWRAAQQHKILYIDGEMPIYELKNRIKNFDKSSNLLILSTDLQIDNNLPPISLSAGEMQNRLDEMMPKDVKLIIVDNLSCLTDGKENDAESWSNISSWALKQRSSGKAVIFIHHSGKAGTQRGTSRREDILDIVINIRKKESEQGNNLLELVFEKARHLTPDQSKPFLFTFNKNEKGNVYFTQQVNKNISKKEKILDLLKQKKYSIRKIAEMVSVSSSKVFTLKKENIDLLKNL